MRRILLIVAMLLATQAFAADVTVKVVDEGLTVTADVNKTDTVRIGYTGAAAVDAIRAFALQVTVDNNTTIWRIRDFNVGDNNGHGIFPGKFRDFINPATPNWMDPNYTPVAPWGDPDMGAGTTIGSGKIITEQGSLYIAGKEPGTSGTLYRIDVNSQGKGDCNLCVTTNATRGGVVKKDANAATVAYDPCSCIKLSFITCPPAPASVTVPASDANNGRYQICWAASSGATSYKINRGTSATGPWTLVASGIVPTCWCDDTNTPATYWYQVCATSAGGDSAFTTSGNGCVVTLCFPSADPNFTNWKSWGKPRCWCYSRQCNGDTDGLKGGSSKTGYFYVTNTDLQVFLAAYQKLEPTKGNGIQGEPNVCAAFIHTKQGGSKTGYFWVGNPDLQIFLKYYQVLEPTKGSGVPTCPGTYIDPCSPKPCN